MFIRATQTRNGTTGEIHITHRLVEKRRIGGKVWQVILLNPGRQFPLAKEHRPEVCARIEPLLRGQQELLPTTVSESVERCAQHCFARLVAQSNERDLLPCDGCCDQLAAFFFRRGRS